MAFFAELKRRRVGKVAIAYGAIAWAVTEASSVVMPALKLPEWTVTFVVVFLLDGFPVAMILAWIFDVGPQGIERTEPIALPYFLLALNCFFALVGLVAGPFLFWKHRRRFVVRLVCLALSLGVPIAACVLEVLYMCSEAFRFSMRDWVSLGASKPATERRFKTSQFVP